MLVDSATTKSGADRPVSLLLGNGFSIAATDTFDYRRLLDAAQFGKKARTDRIKAVAAELGTADFEAVVRAIEETAAILELYPASLPNTKALLRGDAKRVAQGLALTLSRVHPENKGMIGDGPMERTNAVLRRFDEVFTLNYDLLLYWALGSGYGHFRDGFWPIDDDLVHALPDEQNIHNLHGALHIWEELDPGGEPITYKQRWTSRFTLIEALRDMLARDEYPLIVMEGTTEQKQATIEASPYLRGCLANLRTLDGSLVTYGWAMSRNDDHILAAIRKSGVRRLYVGIYGSHRSDANAETVAQADKLALQSEGRIKVHLWKVKTAGLW